MKITFRIWITALIIQPIIFFFIIFWDAVIIVPIELFGSLPGLAFFWIVVQRLTYAKIHIEIKWIFLILAAIVSAFLCNLIFFAGIFKDADGFLYILPAPISALLAVVVNGSIINKHFEDSEKDTRQEAYYPD